MTKKSQSAEQLPRMKWRKERRIFTELMIGLDDLFQQTLSKAHPEFDARYIFALRPIFQRIIVNHLNDETSTAHKLAKDSLIPRTTVQRILDDLVHIGWISRSGSHYCLSARTARLPVMSRTAYAKGIKLILNAAKELRSKRK